MSDVDPRTQAAAVRRATKKLTDLRMGVAINVRAGTRISGEAVLEKLDAILAALAASGVPASMLHHVGQDGPKSAPQGATGQEIRGEDPVANVGPIRPSCGCSSTPQGEPVSDE